MATSEKSLTDRIFKADELVLKYLSESGYDPQGFIDPLYRIFNPKSPVRAYLYDYLQSHPLSEERFKKLKNHFQKLPLENKSFDSGRAAYLAATASVRKS